jgi:hypothetical protein
MILAASRPSPFHSSNSAEQFLCVAFVFPKESRLRQTRNQTAELFRAISLNLNFLAALANATKSTLKVAQRLDLCFKAFQLSFNPSLNFGTGTLPGAGKL